jgi:UDP-galactopyranose mutase
MNHKPIAVVGAGFSGAVVAQQLADAGYTIHVFESRPHVGGNCHTERDSETGVMVHVYGPHIFHTNNEEVWQYINNYCLMEPYINRVKARVKGSIYSLPINLHTLNQFFSETFSPKEAQAFLLRMRDGTITTPRNFEEQALAMVGAELYEAFFKGYTQKQWGRDPRTLPAAVLKRLPLRFNYDDNYFNHRYQGIPREGYTALIGRILEHKNIEVFLKQPYDQTLTQDYQHLFYSGPLDKYFDECAGSLAYRTLRFERYTDMGDFQGCAVMNYCDADVPFTRVSEHKHFAPWERNEKTVYFKEFSSEANKNDIPFYPIGLAQENELLARYQELAKVERNITFLGRLGTYRYLDMDVTIAEAIDCANNFLSARRAC